MIYIILCSIMIHALCVAKASAYARVFLSVLLFSHIYFCLGGYFYWVTLQDAYFVGFHWKPDLVVRSISTLSLATTFVALCAFFGEGKIPLKKTSFERGHDHPIALVSWILLCLGLVASVFVLALGSFAVDRTADNRSPFFLIAYQFADMLIPIILYRIGKRGYSGLNVLLILYFMIFASLVGFRYKIALIVIPLLTQVMLKPVSLSRKMAVLVPASACVLVLFSFLTLFRDKFGVPDFNKPLDDPLMEIMYGFFAEANIVFGLSSILSSYVDRGVYFPLDPFLDIFKEWIPRILLPNRTTGDYLRNMLFGFVTDEGMNSATAYPFIGEFAIMGGNLGLWIGAFCYSLLYLILRRSVNRWADTPDLVAIGLGLIAAMMAYYHYTRGYLPQVAKGYIFVFLPYLYLCSRNVHSNVRLPVSRRRSGKNSNLEGGLQDV